MDMEKYFEDKMYSAVKMIGEPPYEYDQNVIDFLKQIFLDGAFAMKAECVGKLKEAWVNTNGKYDINKAVAVIESCKVGE